MRWLWPLGPLPYAVAGLVIFGIALNGTLSRMRLPYQDWTATSSVFMVLLAIAGPVAAAASAYVGWRLCARTRIFASRPGGRSRWQVIARHVSLLLAWCGGAYVCGLVPLVVVTAANATAGGPVLGFIVTGLVGLVVYVVLGYTAGVVIGSFVAIPVAFAAAFAVSVAGTDYVSVLSPVMPSTVGIGQLPAPGFQWLRLAVFGLAIGALLLLSRACVGAPRRLPMAGVAIVIAGVFAGVAAHSQRAVAVNSAGLIAQTGAPMVCTDDRYARTCVHRGHRKQLREVTGSAARALSAYGSRRRFTVWDESLRGNARRGQPDLWVSLDPSSQDLTHGVASEIAGQLVSSDGCARRYGLNKIPYPVDELYTYVPTWLALGGRIPRGYNYPYLHRVKRTEMQRWLRVHKTELDRCTVDPKALPR